MGLDINLNTSKVDISEDDGLNVDLYKDNIDVSEDETDDIIIEITGLKSLNKFIGLEDTPLYYDNGKFFKVENNKIVYTNIEWKDISGDIQEAPEIVDLITELVEETSEHLIDKHINIHNNSEEAHTYIQNIIQENYNTLDDRIDNLETELSEDISNLNTALNTEITNRENADSALGTRIDSVSEDIQAEVITRLENDTILQNNINTLSDSLTAEISTRETADSNLSDSISDLSDDLIQEILDRQASDNNLDSIKANISDVESITGALADSISALDSTVSANYETLDNKIDSINGTLSDSINNLSSIVSSNYEALDNKIDSVNGALSDSITALDSIVSENYNTLDDKIDSINSALSDSISGLDTKYTSITGALDDKIDSVSSALSDSITALDNKYDTITDNLSDSITSIDNKYDSITSGLDDKIDSVEGALSTHTSDTSNPHNVTKTQVGLGNVDNTSDLNKPISTATQNALDEISGNLSSHTSNTNNPHSVTKTQIGLGNVDNTSDLNKPISTATQTALDGKVPNTRTVNNKALSSDITLTYSDVNALSDTTTINDLTTTAQQNALNSGIDSTLTQQITTNQNNISGLSSIVSSNYTTLDNRITSEVNTLNGSISDEETARINADNGLQSQIDAITSASDVTDIVGTYAELQAYDTTSLPDKSIIKVLQDESRNNETTYYRWVITNGTGAWTLIGEEGPYYTKSEADGRFVTQTTTVNNKALSSNITLTASDVGALPDSTIIGNGTLTIQKNSTTIDTFTANATSNKTININVPTDTNDLTNGAGYITGITSSDVTTALGFTPYNATNPDGYITSSALTPYALISSLSTVATSGLYSDLTGLPTIPTMTSQLTNNSGFITSADLPTNYLTTDTAQDVSGRKTFLGEKAIYFKQQATSNKLGFTLYNPSNTELGALEYRPSTIGSASLLAINCPQATGGYVGFRYWGTPAVNIVAPKVATAGNYYIPTHITDGNTTVTASNNGTVNISTLLPTIPTVGNGTITINQGGTQKGTFTVNQSNDTTINLDAGGGTVDQTFNSSSVNAQSGVAIAGELANYVLSDSSNSIDIYSETSIGFNAPETTDITANGYPIITSFNILSNDAYLTIGEYLNNYGIYLYDSDYVRFFYAEDGSSGLSAYSSNRQSHYAIDLLPSGISFGNEDYTTTITVPSNGSLAVNGSEVALKSDIPDISTKQDTLVSGTNIKTINNQSILGSGNLSVGTVKSINNTQPDSNGNISIEIPTNISDLTDDTATYPIDKAESVVDNNSGNLKFWSGTQAEYNNYEINTDVLTIHGTPTFNTKTGIASEFAINKFFKVIATTGDTIYLKIKATDIQTKQGIFGGDVSIGIYNGYLGYNTQGGAGVFTNVVGITANQYIYVKIYIVDSDHCNVYYNFDGSNNYNRIIAGSNNLFFDFYLGRGYIEGSNYPFNGEINLSESYLVSNNQTEYFTNNIHENNIVYITTDTNKIYKGNVLLSDDNSKQDTLVSGTNIKTINNTSLLGGGNIDTLEGVQINGTDLTISNKKVNIPVASASTLGVGMANTAYGVYNYNNYLAVSKATDSLVTAKANNFRPLVPSNIDLAVKTGITTNTLTLTDAEKTTARSWLGTQAELVSGTNIKTVNSTSLLGSGNIDTSEIFVAEYNVTSWNDIVSAYNSGKTIICKYLQEGSSSDINNYPQYSLDYFMNVRKNTGDLVFITFYFESYSISVNSTNWSVYSDNVLRGTLQNNTKYINTYSQYFGVLSTYDYITVYDLIDTTTGLIPDARISSNIARTSQIITPTYDSTNERITW